ncbi:hypothetical protein D9M68_929170 [compost metagenome]
MRIEQWRRLESLNSMDLPIDDRHQFSDLVTPPSLAPAPDQHTLPGAFDNAHAPTQRETVVTSYPGWRV